MDGAPMLLNNAVGDRKTEANPFALFFGCKEGFEKLGKMMLRNAHTRVFKDDLDGFLGLRNTRCDG